MVNHDFAIHLCSKMTLSEKGKLNYFSCRLWSTGWRIPCRLPYCGESSIINLRNYGSQSTPVQFRFNADKLHREPHCSMQLLWFSQIVQNGTISKIKAGTSPSRCKHQALCHCHSLVSFYNALPFTAGPTYRAVSQSVEHLPRNL